MTFEHLLVSFLSNSKMRKVKYLVKFVIVSEMAIDKECCSNEVKCPIFFRVNGIIKTKITNKFPNKPKIKIVD